MPVGANAGGQLNLVMFEIGMITKDPLGELPDVVKTIAVHPFVVAPTQIAYRDSSRGSVQSTHDSAVHVVAGRAPREVTLTGTFGVESRGLGPYIGTGELRFQKVYHEVVRLVDAVSKAQVDAEKDPFRSPFLDLLLKSYSEENSSFFLNWYDFWHGIQFSAHIPSFSWERSHNKGGATGMTHYRLQATEAGPIVTGGIGTTLLSGLFNVLTTWDQLNELIKSYTLEAVTEALGAAVWIVAGQATETFNAGKAWLSSKAVGVTGLLSGFQNEPVQGEVVEPDEINASEFALDGYADYLGTASEVATQARGLADRIATITPAQLANVPGAVAWHTQRNEGQIDALEAADQREALLAVAHASSFQRAAGAFYGMSRAEYAEWLGSNARHGRGPTLKGSVTHIVTPWDSPFALEKRYGVSFDKILSLNQLLPTEALLTGTKLQIPQERPAGGQSQIDGLPVFGSHAGRAAWGKDVTPSLETRDGRLVVVDGEEVLVQGMNWLIAQFGAELLEFLRECPDIDGAQEAIVRQRLTSIFLSDRRISEVAALEVAVNDATGLIEVEATVVAINGDTVSTGGF